MESPQQVLAYVGQLAILAGFSVGGAWALFRILSEQWLEARFARQLEDHRAELNRLFDRQRYVHEHEFKSLVDIWNKAQMALGLVNDITTPFSRSVNLDRLSVTELDRFLEGSPLTPEHRSQVKESSEKRETFTQLIFWYGLSDAQRGLNEFHNAIIGERIFLSPQLREELSALDSGIAMALVDVETGRGPGGTYTSVSAAYQAINAEATTRLPRIENLIRTRLGVP